MATNYEDAVRRGAMAATRLHQQLGTREKIEALGGAVDVFGVAAALNLPLLIRPLDGLLGAYLPSPIPGVLVTTRRPLSIQRFTAAHELGHFRLDHLPSLDNENILRRMAMPNAPSLFGSEMQEVEADAFAVSLLMPRWLINWHCLRQGWLASDLNSPMTVYQLALRLGTSYEATTWTLQRLKLVSARVGRFLRDTQPRSLKVELLRDYRPPDYRGDVWLLREQDSGTRIDGSRNDLFVLRLAEHSGAGYLWDIDQLKSSGFAIIRDDNDALDSEGIGSPVFRNITAALEEIQHGELNLSQIRPWAPEEVYAQLSLEFDFTGPEEEGLSRAERRLSLEAA